MKEKKIETAVERGGKKKQKLRRGACKEFLQDEVSTLLRDAVGCLREKILKGDTVALKTLWQMSGLDKEKQRTRKRGDAIAGRILKRIQEREAEAAVEAKRREEEGEAEPFFHDRVGERLNSYGGKKTKAAPRNAEELYREAEALLARGEAKRKG